MLHIRNAARAGRVLTAALAVTATLAATTTATAAGGADLTPAHKAQVKRFVNDALDVERKLDGYAREWKLMPRANAACAEPHARPHWAGFVGMVANHMVGYVTTAERGELKLYRYSRDLAKRSEKRSYVAALDAVGKAFDSELGDGRYGQRISHMIAGGQCGNAAIGEATVSMDWRDDLARTRKAIGALELAWAV